MAFNLKENSENRLWLDRLVRWLVSIGGVSILAMLLLIFVFLCVELIPIFNQNNRLEPPTITESLPQNTQQLVVSSRTDVLYARNEQGQFVDLTTQQAVSDVVPIKQAVNRGREPWQLNQISDSTIETLSLDSPDQLKYAILLPVELSTVSALEYVSSDAATVVVGTTDSELFAVHQTASGKRQVAVLQKQELQIENFALNSSGDGLLMWGEQRLTVARLEDASIQTLTSQQEPAVDISRALMIPGSFGFISQSSTGELYYWSLLALDQGFELELLGRLSNISPQAQWSIMHKYRSVLILDPIQGLLAWQLTSKESSRLLSPTQVASGFPVVHFDYLANTDTAYWWNDSALHSVSLSEYRPALSLKSVFGKVWYDGYQQPEFVWQTTALADNYENKVSVVPLVFGTVKAAFYAMLFAIPIAIGGAIYTAYFMSSALRAWVKPTIELMEALPTVIIGFLAGVWLAPLVDENLVSIGLFLVFFPLLIVLFSVVWSAIPRRSTRAIPSGLHLISVVPIIFLSLLLAQWAAPWIEQFYFAGDIQSHLAEQGIAYDQRNSVIVGIAMGFAVIPTIFTLAEEAIYSVPRHLSLGAYALGASRWQALRTVVLQTASAGIVSAIMVGLGRAIGETMIVLMATGNTPVLEWNLFEGMRSLASAIAIEMPESEVGSSHYQILILSAFLLFVFTFLLNSIAEMIRQRLREKYRSL